jgi:hypothetical protein
VDTENLQRYLDSFGKQVVKDANGILSSQKGNTALSKSIRFEVEKDSQGFTTKFYMLDYGTFVDKGVSGNKIKRGYIILKALLQVALIVTNQNSHLQTY